LKIKKLEIVGFKSFVDRTVVNFDHDVTGIVGPNGCGKSNVVDALKWAMGEQSAQRLRGKSMDDVIFNGSEARGPHGFAEVTITFDNTDGLTPPEYADYPEISVTRRLDRAGNSDYSINKTSVRLMDVTNLFLGTGVGRRAYSIIEQGRIGFIVSSKPADRRQMIEEAAGVTKFKVRKHAAERKMEQTRQNLLRIGDIVHELERSLASLQRQAQKAERYKNYRSEVRELELWTASHRYLDIFQETRVVRGVLDQAQARAEGVRYAVQVREAELSGARADADRAGVAVEHAQGKAYALDNRVQMLEGQLAQRRERLEGLKQAEHVAERELTELETQRVTLSEEREHIARALLELEQAEDEAKSLFETEQEELAHRRQAATEADAVLASARARVSEAVARIARAEAVLTGFERRKAQERQRLEQLTKEREGAEVRRIEVGQELSSLEARLTGLRSGSQATQARKDEIEAELRDLREHFHSSDQELTGLREETAERRSRLRSLEELASRFEGVGAGVRALLTQYAPNDAARRERGLLGLAFDLIECPERYTQALAGALGDDLSRVVVEDGDAALAALSFLREEERGRAAFMPRHMRGVAGARVQLPEGEGVIGRLADLVHAQPGHEELVRRLLSGVVVVDSLERGLSLSRDGQDELRIVTLEGEVVEPSGVLRGGAHDDVAAHMLQVRREIRTLHEVVGGLEERLTAAVTRHGDLRRGIAERQAAIDAARNEAHDAEIAIVKADKDLRRHGEERERVEARIEKLTSDMEALDLLLEEAGDEETQARQEIESARAAQAESIGAQEAADAICQSRREAVDAQVSRVSDVRVRAARARERAESDRGAVSRLGRSIQELASRRDRLRGDVLAGARQQGETLGRMLRESEDLAGAVTLAMASHAELEQLRSFHDACRAALFEQEARLRELRVALDEESRRAAEQELRERELVLAMGHLLEQMRDRHDVDLRHVIGDYHDRALPDAGVKTRAEELLRLISRMGEINLMAIEEYEEKSTRFEYLSGQQKDLEEALTKLDRAIRQMNRESKKLFQEAFVAVNERFKLIFPQLFRGGHAELKLTDPDDLLESGIDIIAQPPGKRVGALELMSGGEKALTAVAMIFAIFQYKPSPFCLLDEVDAPLDEANIDRFANAIRQMTDRSQFIVITHSKRTMENADVLYGVTMEHPGVSKLVSVELRGNRRPQKDAPQDARVA